MKIQGFISYFGETNSPKNYYVQNFKSLNDIECLTAKGYALCNKMCKDFALICCKIQTRAIYFFQNIF